MNCLALLFLTGSFTFPIDTPNREAAKPDLQRFQGAWQAATIYDLEGRAASADELKQTRLFVDGNKFTLKGKDYTITGKFSIDALKSPKSIDVVLDGEEGQQPAKLLGIYRFDGESRWSCFALPGDERPKAFPASSKGYIQYEWKRLPKEPIRIK